MKKFLESEFEYLPFKIKFNIILWALLRLKRFVVFERHLALGKGIRLAYKDVNKLSYKEVRQFIREEKFKNLKK